ncbi:ABC transporter substrate-binding protein [Ulvibacter litoralis]|uniref:Iron complex transport system substrate-binding protein n=1 Tax=Ulvibacter litoralis TaxID=227084 RepID=A0A1G7F3Y8_9FLAO|nr:ABC transporter substrate-binding protein [Ulvibacter litoralis]GHC52772.1 ABC transporter substrate-binding protein [Ulvibacter litoralis]SDE70601.1 iron complex transport system substrate-binding protein [Ulvibacter litoralis]
MQKMYYLLSFLFLFLSCKEVQKSDPVVSETKTSIEITHAKGFKINTFDTYKTITLTNPWPGAEKEFTYALISENTKLPTSETFDAVVQIPVKKIVVTSTTHIPSLEMLGTSEALVGFPNLNYISSEATRKRIDAGLVTEIGKNEDLNTETLIDLSPDLVVGFAIDGNNSTFSTLQKTGIPVMYNGDWTETSPLGKAEWIKFFGVLFGKEKEADSIFNAIETDYYKTKELASQTQVKPTVLSGAMYKDVWYLPQGDSWAAQFIADANGDYLWKDSEGTGSLSLNLESVLEKGQHAQYWIGTSQFTTKQQLEETHSVYSKFDAFKNDKLYGSTNKKGATGGLIYYELAPNRPDLVLKDIVKILHPELLPDDELYFFTHLE